MRHLARLIGLLAFFAMYPALAQDAPKQCTKEYLKELEDDLLANIDVRKWTTDYLRPACRGLQRAEDLTGKHVGPYGGKWLWDKTFGKVIDPDVLSRSCKYLRKVGERLLTPEEDEARIRKEIDRCKHVRDS